MQKGLSKAQKSLSNFQSNVKSVMGKVAAVFATIKLGGLIKDSVKAAMSVESSVENINRTMQNSAKAFREWVKSQSKAYGMSIQEGYKYGSTYSNLISSFEGNTKNIANSTQELMKATGIIASKTGRTFEDTAERIRSGMLGSTEAIEDLGVYTQVSMLESTEAFKQLADGKTWQQLNFQTQQQIRLAAILEQTYARYGTTLADTTQTRHNQFIASLKNVQLTLGQAFLPIYNAILPPLTTFINALSKAISVIAQFTTALFGKPKATQQQTQAISSQSAAVSGLGDNLDGVEDSANSAKKAIKSLAGFDELNTLNQSSGSSGGSGGSSGVGGIDTSGLELGDSGFLSSITEVSEKVQAFAEKIKKCFGELKNFIIENKDVIISAISGIAAAFTTYFVMSNWQTIIGGIQGAFSALGAAIGGINLPILGVSVVIGLLVGSIVYLWRTNEQFRDSIIEVWDNIKEFISTVATDIGTILTNLWDKYGKTLINNVKEFFGTIQSFILNAWESVIKPIIENALEMLTWLWDKHLKGVVEELGEFIMKLTNGALEIWNKFISPVVNFLVKTLGPIFVTIFNYIVDSVGTAIAVISDIAKGLLKTFGGIIDFLVGIFTGNWRKAFEGIRNIFKGIFESLVGIAKWPLNMIIDLVNAAISGINSMIKVINKVPGVNISTVPKIPKLAKGGIVDSPTLSLIGEQGREAVMPLENNTGWISDLAEKVATRMPQGVSTNDKPITLKLDFTLGTLKFAKTICTSLNELGENNGGVIPINI